MFKSIKMKKWTSWLMTLVMVLSIIGPQSFTNVKAADVKAFDLVEITDFHGSLEDSSTPALPTAGVLAKDIKDIKNANPDRTLIMGGGDLYQGTPISNVLFGVPVQKVMSNIGMEVTAVGNHEFDWTLDKIKDTTMVGASYDMICANLKDKATGNNVFAPYKIITKDGLRIAIVGAITTETPSIVLAANVANYTFTDPATEINTIASDLKTNNKADVVLALIHEGSSVTDLTKGPIFDIANKLKNVDAVFGGHSHTAVNTTAADGKTPIVIGKSNGKGYIDLKMTVDSSNKVSFLNTNSSYIAIDNTNANGYKNPKPVTDPEVMSIVQAAKDQIGPTFNEVIGSTATTLTRNNDSQPFGESYLGNWCCDVIKAKVNADVAFQNNGGVRIDVPAGNITVNTIFTLMPFDNEICTASMTKAQIKAVLEQAVADNGKGIQLSGLKVTYDNTKPSGSRVTDIKRENGNAISDTEKLVVATNDFVMTGGDGFTAFGAAGGTTPTNTPLNDTHILVRDALIENVRTNKGITTSMNNRLVNAGKTIQIVATSDVHGNMLNWDYGTNAAPSKGQGLAKVSTYVKGLKATNPNVMLVDDGDTIQGTPLVYYYNMIDKSTLYPTAAVMGAMGYDTETLGNHEFNYGLGTLNRIISDYKSEGMHVLSANTYKADNTNFVEPYFIKSFNVNGSTIKVGILGLTTKCIPSWEDPAHYAGLHFNDLVDEAKTWVPKVRAAGADVVIVTAHTGEEGPADVIPENEAKALATQVSGIDAIVAGHAHSTINDLTLKNPEGKVVPVIEPGKWANTVSQIDIGVDATGKFAGLTTKNVNMDNTIAEDPAIVSLVKPYQDKTLAYTATVLGQSTGEYKGDKQLVQPTEIMELINKIQAKTAGTQLSIAAPLSLSAYIPKGDITIKDIMGVYIYENFLFGVKMTGKQVKDWMEYTVRYYNQVSSPSDKVVKDPKLNIADYNLDQLYGATYDIDLTQPACTLDAKGRVVSGNRIKNLKYNGKLVKDTDVFTVAINNYRYNGGGGFMAAAGISNTDPSLVTYDSAKALGDDGQVRSLMTKYVKDSKTITPSTTNNWKIYTTAVTQQVDPVTPVTPVTPATPAKPANPSNGTKLPQTGSPFDTGVLIDLGALFMAAGAAFVIAEEKKKRKSA